MKISNRELDLLAKKHRGSLGKKYLEDVKKISLGEPIDYVLGNSEFLGNKIDLSYKPLIPRVETEYWVEKAIAENIRKKDIHVLDIFSGSGCIGISVAKRIKESAVYFSDSELQCVKQIKKNIKLNKIKNKTKVIRSNIFKKTNGKFDIVFANPPYIPAGRKKNLPKSVVGHESGKYLFSGIDGLFVIKRFIKSLPVHLKPGGVAYIEFDSSQKKQIKDLLVGAGLEADIRVDQYGKSRWVKAWTKS